MKTAGAGFAVVKVPLNPIPTDEFGAMLRLWSSGVAVTFALPAACAQVAFQPGGVIR